MSNPFVQDPISGYNTNPPSNDGTESVANTCDWDLHVIAKVGTPLKNYASANFTKIATAFSQVLGGAGITNVATSYAVLSSDRSKLVVVSAGSRRHGHDARCDHCRADVCLRRREHQLGIRDIYREWISDDQRPRQHHAAPAIFRFGRNRWL